VFMHYMREVSGQSRLNPGIKELVDHFLLDNNNNLAWDQDLLRQLLFQATQAQSLSDLIRGKEGGQAY